MVNLIPILCFLIIKNWLSVVLRVSGIRAIFSYVHIVSSPQTPKLWVGTKISEKFPAVGGTGLVRNFPMLRDICGRENLGGVLLINAER